MTINELLAVTIPLCTFIVGLYILGLKEIQRRRDRDEAILALQAKKDRESLEAIIDAHLNAKMDEFKRNYAEMISLIKSGTLK